MNTPFNSRVTYVATAKVAEGNEKSQKISASSAYSAMRKSINTK